MIPDLNDVVHKNPENWETYPVRKMFLLETFDSIFDIGLGTAIFIGLPEVTSFFGLPHVVSDAGQVISIAIIGWNTAKMVVSAVGTKIDKHRYIRCKHCHTVICNDCHTLIMEGDL